MSVEIQDIGQVKVEIINGDTNQIEITSTKIYPEIVNGDTINIEISNTPNDIVKMGQDSPEGVVEAGVGIIYSDNLNGNLYIKNTGNEATGWVKLANDDEIYIAGENLEAYKIGYIANSGKAYIAGSDNTNSRDLVRGMILDTVNEGEQVRIRKSGIVINQNWTWGQSGNLYLQSAGNIGIVPPSVMGSYIQKIAIIKSSMVILLNIENTIGI